MSAAGAPDGAAAAAVRSQFATGRQSRVLDFAVQGQPARLPADRARRARDTDGPDLRRGRRLAQPQLPDRQPVADRPRELRDRPGPDGNAVADGGLHRCSSSRSAWRARSTSRSTPNRELWFNRFIELNIQNLAAVPSIVYGVLGLAFLARGPLSLGHVLLAGGLTLGLLVLPVLIVAAREAIRAVPPSIREGSMALGATKWQTIWKQTLPAALPGIATGAILVAVARDRRDGAADRDRRGAVRDRVAEQPVRPGDRAADSDLRLDLGAAGRATSRSRRRGSSS